MSGSPLGSMLTRESVVRSIAIGVAAAVLAGVVSLILPKIYRAEVIILPSTGAGSAFPGLPGAGGISNVLEAATLRRENPIQTFPEILLGRVVLGRVLDLPYPPGDSAQSQDVMHALRTDGRTPREREYRGVRKMREMVNVSANARTGMIAVSAETPDSILSAYIANSLISELDRFNVETRRSQGRAMREFVAGRLAEAQRELSQAEGTLAAFRQANLRIGNSPQLNLEEERLKRAVSLRADTYQLLAHQFEMARIEEFRDTPTFSIVEPAIPPYRKAKPQTLVNCAVSFALAGLLALFWDATFRARGTGPTPSRA